MKTKHKLLNIFLLFLITSCANQTFNKSKSLDEKKFFSSKGFALIYDNITPKEKLINNKSNVNDIVVLHSFLKRNTPIKIVNPENSKFVATKVIKNVEYPKIFNVLISKKTADVLGLNHESPYVEIYEYKINKTFVAKKSNTFDEEKNVAGKAPVDEIKMSDLSVQKEKKQEVNKTKNEVFKIFISDFYYKDSAESLKKHLNKETKLNNFYIKKINNKKYRLLSGPFKNFNALKSTYISLNNLGFEDLNIYKE